MENFLQLPWFSLFAILGGEIESKVDFLLSWASSMTSYLKSKDTTEALSSISDTDSETLSLPEFQERSSMNLRRISWKKWEIIIFRPESLEVALSNSMSVESRMRTSFSHTSGSERSLFDSGDEEVLIGDPVRKGLVFLLPSRKTSDDSPAVCCCGNPSSSLSEPRELEKAFHVFFFFCFMGWCSHLGLN